MIDEVAAAITTVGTLARVDSGAVAMASGVRPNPASAPTLSRTISSCASRLVVSATEASSLTISSILRPATSSPCSAIYSFAAASICRPVEAKGPVMGRISPTLNGSAWAMAGRPASAVEAARTAPSSRLRLCIWFSSLSGLRQFLCCR